MSSNYWTDGRQQLCRLQAAFVRMNDIVRDLVDLRFSIKHDYMYPSLADHWQQWSYDNYGYIKRFRFWKKQAKEPYKDREIPKLDSADVTFFAYLMAEIDPDCPSMKMFQEIRNAVAHMTETELNESAFKDRFHKIIEAVNVGFQSNPEARKRWSTILESIRRDKISNPEEVQSQFQKQAENVKWQVSQKNFSFGNVQDCQNVKNVYNITVTGDMMPSLSPGLYELHYITLHYYSTISKISV